MIEKRTMETKRKELIKKNKKERKKNNDRNKKKERMKNNERQKRKRKISRFSFSFEEHSLCSMFVGLPSISISIFLSQTSSERASWCNSRRRESKFCFLEISFERRTTKNLHKQKSSDKIFVWKFLLKEEQLKTYISKKVRIKSLFGNFF
jgi:hypothetical protein